MKTSLEALEAHAFECMDYLNDRDVSGKALEEEFKRAEGTVALGKLIIESRNVAIKDKEMELKKLTLKHTLGGLI